MIFYFTCHPGDMTRQRMLPGAAVMTVASAFWDDDRRRLRVRRPPADHIGALVIDSGGFTAARKYGRYPWSPEQYCDWLREESRDIPLRWAASMDYACEREVNRDTYRTNLDRIQATIENELSLREMAPDIPWLGVLQGNTLDERAEDVRLRQSLGLIQPLMGIGSICGRKAREAAAVIRFYGEALPGVRYHAFGLDVRTLDLCAVAAYHLESWDSYAWTWGKGCAPKGGADASHGRGKRRPDETWSMYTLRLAHAYETRSIQPRLTRPRQIPLEAIA